MRNKIVLSLFSRPDNLGLHSAAALTALKEAHQSFLPLDASTTPFQYENKTFSHHFFFPKG